MKKGNFKEVETVLNMNEELCLTVHPQSEQDMKADVRSRGRQRGAKNGWFVQVLPRPLPRKLSRTD